MLPPRPDYKLRQFNNKKVAGVELNRPSFTTCSCSGRGLLLLRSKRFFIKACRASGSSDARNCGFLFRVKGWTQWFMAARLMWRGYLTKFFLENNDKKPCCNSSAFSPQRRMVSEVLSKNFWVCGVHKAPNSNTPCSFHVLLSRIRAGFLTFCSTLPPNLSRAISNLIAFSCKKGTFISFPLMPRFKLRRTYSSYPRTMRTMTSEVDTP